MAKKVMYGQQLAKKVFRGMDQKDAYMKAVKWYASNILASDKFHEIMVEYTKLPDGGITMTMWSTISQQEIMDDHCQCCREMHHSFFINEDTHCDRCSAISFQKRLEWKMGIKLDYYKEILHKLIGK